MKKEDISNLRYSQKIMESHTFLIVDGLQKKIRKKIVNKASHHIDAEKKFRQIISFWKQEWQYQRFHPLIFKPKVFYPIILMSDPQSQTDKLLKTYGQTIKKLINRLRLDNQSETNYKLEPTPYLSCIQPTNDDYKYFKVAEMAVNNMFNSYRKVLNLMNNSVDYSNGLLEQKDDQLNVELKYLQAVLTRSSQHKNQASQKDKMTQENKMSYRMEQQDEKKRKSEMQQEKQNQTTSERVNDINQQTLNLQQFSANVCKVLDKMKRQDVGPSFVSVQPQIGDLTYIIHPIFPAIHSLLLKQKIQISKVNTKQRQMKEYENMPQFDDKIPGEKIKLLAYLKQRQLQRQKQENKIWKEFNLQKDTLQHFQNDMKRQDESYSKILFINLDGYQSQFNIQTARNYPKNLMYVSFPKFTSNSENLSCHQRRFYKKIMFETTRPGDRISSSLQQLQMLYLQQGLKNNPQEYYENIDQLWEKQSFNMNRNSNLEIFPIKMNVLVKQNMQLMKNAEIIDQKLADQNMQDNQSYLVNFIFRNYLSNRIKQFHPTHTIISYSNKISIEDEHFVNMIQQLVRSSNNKIMFYCNFTTSFVKDLIYTKEKQKYSNNNYQVDRAELKITNQLAYRTLNDDNCFDQCPLTLASFSKLVKFLKISSGTYNLQQNFQQENLNNKIRTVKTYAYIQFLFKSMSKQYLQLANKIDKNMLLGNKMYLENSLNTEQKNLLACEPKFYQNLFKQIKELILHKQKRYGEYSSDVDGFFTNIIRKTKQLTQDSQYKIVKRILNEFIQCELKSKSENKFQQKLHIYLKTKWQIDEYKGATQDSINKNKAGLHIISFGIDRQKILPIYKDTSVLFQTNQISEEFRKKSMTQIFKKQSINKPQAFILVMNHLGIQNQRVQSYIGKIRVNQKSSFNQQFCLMKHIQFIGTQEYSPFKVKCQWNFKETSKNLILYWPSEYDFIRANLFKLSKYQYESRICDQIYLASKQQHTKFHKLNIILDSPIIPRRGCSSYQIDNKLYIFGGVYEREYNYLQNQNDIVTIDFNQMQVNGQNKQISLKNLKKQLYSQQYLQTVVNQHENLACQLKNQFQGKKINAFIRPKIQLQFYQWRDLSNNDIEQNIKNINKQVHTVVMIGGYGENYLSPHSLLAYFYHVIKFCRVTRTILSIQKYNTYEKSLAINIQQPIKNKHIFQNMDIYHESDTLTNDITTKSHYFFHRVAYQLVKRQHENQTYYELNYKFLFLYALEYYQSVHKNYEEFARKIGDRRVIEQNQNAQVQTINGCNNNLLITKDQSSYLYSLNYKSQMGQKSVPLTNQSIISVDVINYIACALIKHKQYTEDKCVLIVERVKVSNPKKNLQNQIYTIDLVNRRTFDQNYQMFALFLMKRTQLVIVHGNSFKQYQISDRFVCAKYSQLDSFKEIIEEKSGQIQTIKISDTQFFDCTSFFLKVNHNLLMINFMTHYQSKQLEFIYAYDKSFLDANANKKQWTMSGQMRYYSFCIKSQTKEQFLGRVKFISVIKESPAQNYCIISSNVTNLSHSKQHKTYKFNIDSQQQKKCFYYKNKKVFTIKVQEYNQPIKNTKIVWKKVYKNQQRYEDCNIKKI